MPAQTSMPQEGEHDPRHHSQKIRERLKELSQHLRDDVGKIDEPQAKAIFETSAEVLDALAKTFEDYEQKSEKAWRA